MASTTFVDGSTLVVADWLNDVNAKIYGVGTSLTGLPLVAGSSGSLATYQVLGVVGGGTGSATAAGARTNLGAAASGANTDITSLSSPALGAATATTQSPGDNTTKVATTAFVTAAVSGSSGSTQIQPISASVAANALTISASALSLTFRSTTLGSGALTTVSGTPANLVISSGSTLGTINATQSDIVVIAINNAGTIELAAVNLSGGVQLDETNLVTTTAEGGAGAADSASTVYSTTARTSLAYRVLGIIRSTQTTAGTWATAPSLIQGSGGNALTSMSSLGYSQTWQAVTRVLGTTYYNTTGRPIVLDTEITSTSTINAVICTINGVAVFQSGHSGSNGSYGCWVIPPYASYVLSTSGGTSPTVTANTRELR